MSKQISAMKRSFYVRTCPVRKRKALVVYTAAVAVGGPAIARRPPLHTRGGRRARRCRRRRFLCLYLLVAAALFCSADVAFGAYGIEIGRPATLAGTSRRGRWYYIKEGFCAMVASADPNRVSPEPSSGSSDDANGQPDRSYSCV